jgi:hypothetical protein
MPQTAPQSSTSNVLPFPTASSVVHRQPAQWWERPLPENVQRLRELPPRRTLSPEALLISAFIEANAMSKTLEGQPDLMVVNESLKDALHRFEGDREAQASVYRAMQMLWAYRSTGRW